MHKKKVVNKELHAIRRYAQQHEQLSEQTEHQTIYGGRYSYSNINRYCKKKQKRRLSEMKLKSIAGVRSDASTTTQSDATAEG